ncbi:MAG TPA: SRPBCC family protein [Candidatus Bathyarchaeia archaeon]|nr:SRPBCC family protein [Candidatus Bathyarchaeia archaeon]
MATAEVKLEGRLAAPAWVVWSRLSDLEALASWLDEADDIHVTGRGRFAKRRFRLGGRVVEDEVLELVPGRRLGLALRGLSPWLAGAYLRADLLADDDGTRLVLKLHLAIRPRWLGPIVKPLVRLRAEVALYRVLRAFRSWIEEQRAESAAGRAAISRPSSVRAGGRRLGASSVESERLAAL